MSESSLEFVRGSHRWGKFFAPVAFGTNAGWTADFRGEECPDIEAARDRFDIVGFDVDPGDALVFSAWTLHGAPGNASGRRRVALSTRWLGDDARWAPRPGCDPTVKQADVCVAPGTYPADDDCFPEAWRDASAIPAFSASLLRQGGRGAATVCSLRFKGARTIVGRHHARRDNRPTHRKACRPVTCASPRQSARNFAITVLPASCAASTADRRASSGDGFRPSAPVLVSDTPS